MTLLNRTILLLSLLLAGMFSASGEEWTEDGFRVPQPNPALSFPEDHGSHPEYRIEWWYLTGHLFADDSRRFGVQATFFRLAQQAKEGESDADFSNGPMFLAHMALTDVKGGKFYHEERLNRAGWDAWAKTGDLDLRKGNWTLKRTSGLGPGSTLADSEDGEMRLRGSIQSDVQFELKLNPAKPPVLFGENGVSRKGEEPSAASLYLTFPRLTAEGSLSVGGKELSVSGELWMDHEVSSSQLGRDQVGWDWVSVQFFDGREMMAYILRKPDGSPDRFSSLAWIDEEGQVAQGGIGTFEWSSQGNWQSETTGDTYPISPRVATTDPESGERRTFRIVPVMEAQEMTGGIGGVSYWEGACDVVDEESDEIVGRAYLELTGYAKGDDLGRRLRGE